MVMVGQRVRGTSRRAAQRAALALALGAAATGHAAPPAATGRAATVTTTAAANANASASAKASAPGPAAARVSRLAFEVLAGDRSPVTAALFEQLAEELEVHGFTARTEALRRALGERTPLPGVSDPDASPDALATRVNAGVRAYAMASFADAVATLTDAIQTFQRNPGRFVSDTRNVELIARAHVALALAQDRLGRQADSVATMTELVRLTRGQPISRAEFGGEADALHRAALRQVQARGRGALAIRTGSERALVFVDGALRGVGTASLRDLAPGAYQVLVQLPGTEGRRYVVDVETGAERALDVDAELEQSLSLTGSSIGLRLASAAPAEREARLASALARRWATGSTVATIGVATRGGRPALVGALFRTDGSFVRGASVPLDALAQQAPPDAAHAPDAAAPRAATVEPGRAATVYRARLRALARFLADGTPDETLALEDPAVRAPWERSRGVHDRSPWATVTVVAGVAAIGAGLALVALDQDPDPSGPQRPTYRDSAPAGVALASMGAAVLGAGLWWRMHNGRREASAPAIAVTRDAAWIGWASRF